MPTVDPVVCRERRDEMWVKGSFYAFISSSAYMFLKRFYLNEILGYLIYFALTILGYLMTVVIAILSAIGKDAAILSFPYWMDENGDARGVASEMVRTSFGGDCGLMYQYQ